MKQTMKNILIIMMTIMLFTNCKNSNTQNNQVKPISDTTFYFCIKDFYNETSKDSHHYYKMYYLKAGVLYYEYKYRGFPSEEDFTDSKQLNDTLINDIKAKLSKLSLNRNYNRYFPVDRNGMVSESGLSLNIRYDTVKYNLEVSGEIPYDINDSIYNHLSEFRYYINTLFPQKP
jgi:hypothetical protein